MSAPTMTGSEASLMLLLRSLKMPTIARPTRKSQTRPSRKGGASRSTFATGWSSRSKSGDEGASAAT